MPKQQSIAPTGVRIEPALKARLTELGKVKQRSIHWLLLEAIKSYVITEEEAQQLKQETIARWQVEAEQGLTVDNQQVTDWLQTWGTDKECKRPPCK